MKLKKLLTLFLSLIILCSIVPLGTFTASAATSGTTGDCTWELDGTTLTISGSGAMGDYDYFNKAPWGTDMIEVIIKDGVTTIGMEAFYNCSSLTSIKIPDSVTTIGYHAFYYCSSLTSITIPDSVISIGDSAFSSCPSLKRVNITDLDAWLKIEFGDSTSNPLCNGANLYLNNQLVTEIKIPDGVTTIGSYAFSGCSSLTSITIPDSVTTIGNFSFRYCGSLTSITIPDHVTSIGDSAFSDCSLLTSFKIPDSVTEIGRYAFSGCSSLTSITIPDSVTSIATGAFSDCSSLTSITIPDSVTSIGSYAFSDCSSLTSITIPDSVTSIGSYAFSDCSSLTSITIPDGVTSIWDWAFYECSSLTSIKIPDGVTRISDDAFSSCSSLTSIKIPDSVTSIGYEAFSWCFSLERVDITDLDAWLKIGFGNNNSNPLRFGASLYLNNQLVTEIKIPDGTQIINEYQCYNMKDVEDVFIPKSLILVKQNAFNGCESIKNVYYEGTAEEWSNVTILAGNDHLKNATVYYNSIGIPGGITSVAVTKSPDKLQYIENTENLDLTGGVLTVYYDGGATLDIDLATLKVDGFDNSVFGKQTLTVRYGEFLAEFEIEIISRPISFVAISTLPTKREYVLGEKLDLTGGKIAVGYPEGNYEIFDLHDAVISAYDTNKTGYQIITVTYKGHITEFTVAFFKNGDLDGDENINATDVAMLRINLLVNSDHNTRCDINKDGTTDIRDLVNLKKKTVEIIA